MATPLVKVIVSSEDGRVASCPVLLTRVPCVGELVEIGCLYRITRVIHLADPFDSSKPVARITVIES